MVVKGVDRKKLTAGEGHLINTGIMITISPAPRHRVRRDSILPDPRADHKLHCRHTQPLLTRRIELSVAVSFTYNMASSVIVPVPPYMTSDKTSFAYISAKDRWPVIVVSRIPYRPYS